MPRLGLIALRESVCLEVCAEIKNLSTYTGTVSKQYLLLPVLIIYDEVEPCVALQCVEGSAPRLSSDVLILFKSLIPLVENTIYTTGKRFFM